MQRVRGSRLVGSARAGDIEPAGPKWFDPALVGIEAMARDASVVVAEQMQRDGGHVRCRGDHVNVSLGSEFVEVAGGQVALFAGLEIGPDVTRASIGAGEDLLGLCTAIETDNPPGEMIMDRSRRPGWNDQTGKREVAITGAIEQPHTDAAAHSTGLGWDHIVFRQPVRIGQQRCEEAADLVHDGFGRKPIGTEFSDLMYERAVGWVIEIPLVAAVDCGACHSLTHDAYSSPR